MEHGQQGRDNRQTSRREPRQRQSTGGKKHGVWFVLGTILLIFAMTFTMLFGIFMVYVKTTLAPTLNVDASQYTMDLSSILYYQDKTTGKWRELQTLHGTENRIWVDYDKIPKALWQGAVSIEDKRFFKHHGVDWGRTSTAAVNMFLGMRSTYGGSTITQQLLKNLTGDKEGTVKRKITEIFRALEFEKKYSKQEIMEMYLNTIFLGKNCYGVQTASQYYFGKKVSDLDVAECASLIGITNNPSIYNPLISDKTRANNKKRQEQILKEMYKQGYIDKETYDSAAAEKLQFTDGSKTAAELVAAAKGKGGTEPGKYNSYFVDQVIRDVVSDMQKELGLSEKAAHDRIYHGGYKIYTTIDPEVQGIAESVYKNRSNLNVISASGQPLQSGITIVDVSTGDVVAMVGGVGEKTGDMVWNYATDVQQCGSSIKPLTVYAPALDAGVITMASSFDNYPVRLLNGKPWPKNSPSGYTGLVTLSTGVANSINTVAVRTIEKLGVSNSYKFATKKLDMTTLCSQDLNSSSLGLGGLTKGTTTEEMAAAYASFANDGVYNSPRLYTRVADSNEKTVMTNKPDSHVAMKETTSYFMNELLQGVVNSGTGTSAKFPGMALAGKTGTTSDNYDRYFVGYSPYYCAAVWSGYKNNEKIRYSGNPSITMWKKVMQQVHAKLENKQFDKPTSGLTKVTVCADSGLLATNACAMDVRGNRVRTVEVAEGTAPTAFCNLHVIKNFCSVSGRLAGPNCPAEDIVQRAVLNYSRKSYGVPVSDSAYLLSTYEALGECPVHSGVTPPNGGSTTGETGGGTDPGNTGVSQDTGGNTGTGTGTDPGTTTPPANGTRTAVKRSLWWGNPLRYPLIESLRWKWSGRFQN